MPKIKEKSQIILQTVDLLLATGLAWKTNFNGCTGPGSKGLDSRLQHYFSVAGIPTSADECLEAVQSNLTGPVLFF